MDRQLVWVCQLKTELVYIFTEKYNKITKKGRPWCFFIWKLFSSKSKTPALNIHTITYRWHTQTRTRGFQVCMCKLWVTLSSFVLILHPWISLLVLSHSEASSWPSTLAQSTGNASWVMSKILYDSVQLNLQAFHTWAEEGRGAQQHAKAYQYTRPPVQHFCWPVQALV